MFVGYLERIFVRVVHGILCDGCRGLHIDEAFKLHFRTGATVADIKELSDLLHMQIRVTGIRLDRERVSMCFRNLVVHGTGRRNDAVTVIPSIIPSATIAISITQRARPCPKVQWDGARS